MSQTGQPHLPHSGQSGVFVVTGAGSGIGQAIAAKIVDEGHAVFGLGRSERKLQETAKRLVPGRFAYAAVDLSRAEPSARALSIFREWLNRREGRLYGLINNAGIFDRVGFLETTDLIWEKQFQNNLLASVRLTRDLFKELKAASTAGFPASVLNISSTLGLRPIAQTSAYSAVKAAMINWSESLALEWAAEEVRVNCLCPGLVDTPIHPFHRQHGDGPEMEKARALAHSAQPLQRMGQPTDIAEAAWFLLSRNSSWTTGAVLTVDGGIRL